MTTRSWQSYFRSFRSLAFGVTLSAAFFATGCASGPSLKQKADDRTEQRANARKQADFEKSLPPTQSKPVFKP